MSPHVVDALADQWSAFAEIAESLGPSDWVKPTRCPPLAVIELVAHVGIAFQFWLAFLGHPQDGEPSHTHLTWLSRTAGTDVGANVISRAKESAAGVAHAAVAARTSEAAATYLDAVRGTSLERVVGDPRIVTIRVGDLVHVGVLEVGVHTLDLAHAVDRRQTLDRRTGPVVRAVLDGLLGRPCPARWDDVTYALTATGRRPLTDADRESLGPDADRFPLMS